MYPEVDLQALAQRLAGPIYPWIARLMGVNTAALVRQTALQAIPNAVITQLVFQLGVYTRGTVTTTIPSTSPIALGTPGIYMVSAGVAFNQQAGGRRVLQLIRNNTSIEGETESSASATSTTFPRTNITIPLLCASGDTFQVQVFQDSGVTVNTYVAAGQNQSYLAVARIV